MKTVGVGVQMLAGIALGAVAPGLGCRLWAFATDADNTGDSALAYFGDVTLVAQ